MADEISQLDQEHAAHDQGLHLKAETGSNHRRRAWAGSPLAHFAKLSEMLHQVDLKNAVVGWGVGSDAFARDLRTVRESDDHEQQRQEATEWGVEKGSGVTRMCFLNGLYAPVGGPSYRRREPVSSKAARTAS